MRIEKMDVLKLAEEIVNGRRLGGEDDLMAFVTCDLDDLCRGADVIREKLCGDKVDLCTIINGKSGRCGEDCKYCAQSAHHHTACEEYGFLDSSVIMDAARANEEEGVDRFAIVTSGKALTGRCRTFYPLLRALPAYMASPPSTRITSPVT